MMNLPNILRRRNSSSTEKTTNTSGNVEKTMKSNTTPQPAAVILKIVPMNDRVTKKSNTPIRTKIFNKSLPIHITPSSKFKIVSKTLGSKDINKITKSVCKTPKVDCGKDKQQITKTNLLQPSKDKEQLKPISVVDKPEETSKIINATDIIEILSDSSDIMDTTTDLLEILSDKSPPTDKSVNVDDIPKKSMKVVEKTDQSVEPKNESGVTRIIDKKTNQSIIINKTMSNVTLSNLIKLLEETNNDGTKIAQIIKNLPEDLLSETTLTLPVVVNVSGGNVDKDKVLAGDTESKGNVLLITNSKSHSEENVDTREITYEEQSSPTKTNVLNEISNIKSEQFSETKSDTSFQKNAIESAIDAYLAKKKIYEERIIDDNDLPSHLHTSTPFNFRKSNKLHHKFAKQVATNSPYTQRDKVDLNSNTCTTNYVDDGILCKMLRQDTRNNFRPILPKREHKKCNKFVINLLPKISYSERYSEFYKKIKKDISTQDKSTNEDKDRLLKEIIDKFLFDVKNINMPFERVDIDFIPECQKNVERDDDCSDLNYTYSLPLKTPRASNNENQIALVDVNDQKIEEEICTTKSMNISNYKSSDMVTDLEDGPKLCEVCGLTFTRAVQFQIHLANHYDKMPFECKACKATFVSFPEAKTHFLNTHTNKIRYICEFCEKGLCTEAAYQAHVKKHKEPGKYLCDICLIYFNHTKLYKYHMKKHDSTPKTKRSKYQCELCGKILKSEPSFVRHLGMHEGKFTFTCEVCGKGFSERHDYNCHKDVHLDVQKYSCEACGKRFRFARSVTHHYNLVHLGIKPYLCTICGARKPTKKVLENHMNQHTGNRPYVCKICGKAYLSPQTLYKHRLTHNPEKGKKCSICEKLFIHSSSYKNHMFSHFGIKKHECTVCLKKFVKKFTLQQHLRSHIHEKERMEEFKSFLLNNANTVTL